MVGVEEAVKVRAADDQRRMVRSANPAHLSLIRVVRRATADGADRKTKKFFGKNLA